MILNGHSNIGYSQNRCPHGTRLGFHSLLCFNESDLSTNLNRVQYCANFVICEEFIRKVWLTQPGIRHIHRIPPITIVFLAMYDGQKNARKRDIERWMKRKIPMISLSHLQVGLHCRSQAKSSVLVGVNIVFRPHNRRSFEVGVSIRCKGLPPEKSTLYPTSCILVQCGPSRSSSIHTKSPSACQSPSLGCPTKVYHKTQTVTRRHGRHRGNGQVLSHQVRAQSGKDTRPLQARHRAEEKRGRYPLFHSQRVGRNRDERGTKCGYTIEKENFLKNENRFRKHTRGG